MRRNKKTRSSEVNIESGNILQRTTVKDFIVSSTILCWEISKYGELKERVIYYQMYVSDDFNCVFKLIKMEKTLYLAVRCNFANSPALFYLAKGDLMSPPCASEEIDSGMYVGEFSQDLLSSPDGDFAPKGELTVVFKIVTGDEVVRVRGNEECCKVGEMSDVDVLCSSTRELYLQGRDSDFVINAGGISFSVHKYMLFARSNFFRKLFSRDNHPSEYTVDINPSIMHIVLLYCYSGELSDFEAGVLKTILSVASKLEISSLEDRCQEDLNKNCPKSLYASDKITEESPSG